MKPHLEEICFLGLRSQSHELENRGEKGLMLPALSHKGRTTNISTPCLKNTREKILVVSP